MTALIALLLGGAAALLQRPPRAHLPDHASPTTPDHPGRIGSASAADAGWLHRWRPLWCALAGAAAAVVLGGLLGAVLAIPAAVVCWVVIGRAEPAAVLRDRAAASRDLPHVVRLLSTALGSGADPAEALAAVVAAFPGPAADRLAPVAARLRLGADPAEAWRTLTRIPELAPLGRSLARAQATGAPVGAAVERLAEELARSARADVEDRARRVGVRAAVPLGLCLLPAFLLIGIVPLVGGLLSTLRL